MSDTIQDIRDQAYLTEREVLKLNFINDSSHYIFRKYYRSGLRFKNKEAVFQEIKKYQLLLKFLGPDFIAESEEFIVDYTGTGKSQIVLCGLQEYIEGEILDPWGLGGKNFLLDLFKSSTCPDSQLAARVEKAQKNITIFVKKIRQMISDTGYIPDLAGFGNLILTIEGNLKLVDINNIVEIKLNNSIPIDDKGYPSCDVSVEVLSLLEKDILQKNIQMDDPLYRFFLSPERKIKVKVSQKNRQTPYSSINSRLY
jgi:hypothetical protein